jgi:predicted amidohydrolase YtcJ
MPVAGLVPAEHADDPADLVVRNGRIYTGDPRRPYAGALAVRDGRVLAVGDDYGMAPHVTKATRVVDAMGRRVIPGLIDAHMHVIRTGLHYLLELRWDGVRSLGQALAMLRDQASRTPPGQWVNVIGGWSTEQFAEQRLPTLGELNAAAPDTPVMITHLYQSVLLNRAALQAAGYTRDAPGVPGGQIVRDYNGEPTGLLLAAPAATLLYAAIGKAPVLSEDGQLESTRHFLHELNRFGLTSAIDAAGGFQSFPENYAAVTRLAADGALSVRLAYHLFPQVPGQELDDMRRWIASVRPGDGDDWLRLNGAGEGLVASANDFENFAEPRPELPDSAGGDLEAAVRLLADHGWPFRLHATYDETIRMDLDAFERTGAFPGGVRWILDHAETISPESIDRVAALGGAISVQHRMAQLYGPDNLLDRETALRLYTTAGAELTGEADHKGMLAAGYLADLAVLSDDYFAVPAEDISRIESVLTVTGGRIVYAAAEYEGLATPLPPIEPAWSPVAHYGGYQQSVPSGAAQARAVADAAYDSLEQRRWHMARGGPETSKLRELDDTCAERD